MSKLIQPTYLATQPSTGLKVKFRPFTVKEEKALMLALQESDVELATLAIKSVITACTDLNPDEIPYYDVEYLYLQIRSKSIGEIVALIGGCSCSDKAQNEFDIDVTEATVLPAPEIDKIVKVPGTDYSLKVKHPSIDDFAKLIKSNADNAEEIVANCITSIFTGEEVMDWGFKERLEFVESMTQIQQKEVVKFLKNMPMVKLSAKYKCKLCGKEHNQSMSGFQNFFI